MSGLTEFIVQDRIAMFHAEAEQRRLIRVVTHRTGPATQDDRAFVPRWWRRLMGTFAVSPPRPA